MMVGLPGSGKSTWINEHGDGYTVISSDNIIEAMGKAEGLSYADAWVKFAKEAGKQMNVEARQAIKNKEDILWDQTNLVKNSRRKKMVGMEDYHKTAVVFDLPDEVLQERLETRKATTGKTVAAYVIRNMSQIFEMPTKEEGFNDIIIINS